MSAAVYATLIVTFGFQVARVEGQSMAPTLANQDRLIVNKFAYLVGAPQPRRHRDALYPVDPDKSFVKRVIAEAGDTVKIEDGRVYVNDVALADDFVAPDYRSHDDHRAARRPARATTTCSATTGTTAPTAANGARCRRSTSSDRVQLRWWPVHDARVF